MSTIGTLTNGHGAIVTVVKKTDGGYHLMPNRKPAKIETTEITETAMDKNIQAYQSYDVTYKPDGASDEVGHCTIRVKPRDSHDAMRRAAWVTGRQVWNPVRVD